MAGPRSDDKNKESATKKKGLGSDDNKTAIAGEVQQQQASVGVATVGLNIRLQLISFDFRVVLQSPRVPVQSRRLTSKRFRLK